MLSLLAVVASLATLATVVLSFVASLRARPLQPDLHRQFQNTWLELQYLSGTLRDYLQSMAAHAQAGKLLDPSTGITPRALAAFENGAAEAAASHDRIVKLEFGDVTPEIAASSAARGWMVATAVVGGAAAVLQILVVVAGK